MAALDCRRSVWWLIAVGATLLLTASSVSAQQIRVLLVIPTGSSRLARQVARLNDALGKSKGRIVQANTLQDADAVVQFTNYRRVVDAKGESEDWWYGEYFLLKRPIRPPVPPPGAVPGVPQSPTFVVVVYGREDWEVEPVVEVLGQTLANVFGVQDQAQDGTI